MGKISSNHYDLNHKGHPSLILRVDMPGLRQVTENIAAPGFWRMAPLLCLLLPCTLPVAAMAQTIETNRPSFSYSPRVVAPGKWQLESGVKYIRTDSENDTWVLPELEFRFGVAKRWELFLNSLNWSRVSSPSGTTRDFNDLVLGTKVNISDPESGTQLAFLAQVTAPVGDDTITSDRWDPSLAFVWGHSGSFAVGGTLRVSDFADGYQVDNGIVLPFSLTASQSIFLEWEANFPEHRDDAHWLNSGYTWLPRDTMQFDINAGLGLTDKTEDFRIGAGFSVLF